MMEDNRCRECDGQGKVVWTNDGGTRPGYGWCALEDKETCRVCNGTGYRRVKETPK